MFHPCVFTMFYMPLDSFRFFPKRCSARIGSPEHAGDRAAELVEIFLQARQGRGPISSQELIRWRATLPTEEAHLLIKI